MKVISMKNVYNEIINFYTKGANSNLPRWWQTKTMYYL